MDRRPAVIAPRWWILATVALAAVAAIVAAWRLDVSGEEGSGLDPRFEYDLTRYEKTDPALVKYRQTQTIAVPLDEPVALAVGGGDRLYVAGDQGVVLFDAAGAEPASFALAGRPSCLAVSGEGPQVYVGLGDHVEVLAEGSVKASWAAVSPKSYLTSIAVSDDGVFVADAGEKIVYRYDGDGKLLGRIGGRDEKKEIRGFFIPSPYFDLAVSADGLVRVVNPAAHRIEAYTVDGEPEHPLTWGRASLAIDGFCGCCNPAHFALLPDGRFVTAEKGLLRVKVYDAEGKFLSVVAGHDFLAPSEAAVDETRPGHKLHVLDVAADSQGRVYVLDPKIRMVRVFEEQS